MAKVAQVFAAFGHSGAATANPDNQARHKEAGNSAGRTRSRAAGVTPHTTGVINQRVAPHIDLDQMACLRAPYHVNARVCALLRISLR